MRHDKLYLSDILEAAEAIQGFIAETTPQDFITATQDVPELASQVAEVLAGEHSDWSEA